MSRLKYCSVVAIIFTLCGPETLDPKLAKGFSSLKVSVMITKNKSHLLSQFKSETNDLCEQKSSAVKASRNRPHRP